MGVVHDFGTPTFVLPHRGEGFAVANGS